MTGNYILFGYMRDSSIFSLDLRRILKQHKTHLVLHFLQYLTNFLH